MEGEREGEREGEGRKRPEQVSEWSQFSLCQ